VRKKQRTVREGAIRRITGRDILRSFSSRSSKIKCSLIIRYWGILYKLFHSKRKALNSLDLNSFTRFLIAMLYKFLVININYRRDVKLFLGEVIKLNKWKLDLFIITRTVRLD